MERIQTDNGSEFQSAFHWHVLDRGIEHVYIRPATPRLNGKVERSHRIDAEEFYRLLQGVVLDETGLFKTKLQEWEDFYNFDRPHGGLGGQTPYERLREKMKTPDVKGARQSHSFRDHRLDDRAECEPEDQRPRDLPCHCGGEAERAQDRVHRP